MAGNEHEVLENKHHAESEEVLALGRRKDVDLEQDDPEGVLLPGLGTMMSDAVDWLNEERRSHFQTWKRNLIKQMDKATVAA